MRAPSHPVFESLRRFAAASPIVVAHRGCSRALPENTLPAFQSAQALGVKMQEFDVRCTRDGALVCIHDASLDRTTDAASRLGPGALVAEITLTEIRGLDAGSWHPSRTVTQVPTLAEALTLMRPTSVPLIEHKAGPADVYVRELLRLGMANQCVLQSFDWEFVAAAKRQLPELAVAVLGPSHVFRHPDDAAIATAIAAGAGMIHWHATELTDEAMTRIHSAGLLVCTYTTDDEPGWRGGAAMGFDAMCTNVPERMLELQRKGRLPRGPAA